MGHIQRACRGQQATVPLYVVEGNGPDLFGRNGLEVFKLNCNKICTVHNQALKEILDSYEKVFEEGLGTLLGFEAKIYVDSEAKPKFCKARPVPYAYCDKIE